MNPRKVTSKFDHFFKLRILNLVVVHDNTIIFLYLLVIHFGR